MIYESECLTEINCFNEYLQFIKDYRKKNKCEIWYRGQSTNEWEVKPNLYRNMKMKCREKNNPDALMKLEYNFVNFNEEFHKLKKEILNNNLFDISNLNNFQIMFIAQHYGLLTPILDWTTDPLVALFFALDNYVLEDDEFPVIYIIKPGLCNEHCSLVYRDNTRITKPLCIDGIENNIFEDWTRDLNNTPGNTIPIAISSNMDFCHRICKQSGKFTFHGAVGPTSYQWNNIIIEGERIVEAIKINPKAVDEMKEYLLSLDITRKSIYREISDLDNICKQLKNEALDKFKENIEQHNKTLS